MSVLSFLNRGGLFQTVVTVSNKNTSPSATVSSVMCLCNISSENTLGNSVQLNTNLWLLQRSKKAFHKVFIFICLYIKIDWKQIQPKIYIFSRQNKIVIEEI